MTHYQTLGVPESASAQAVRAAYRALARAHHPDVNAKPGAEARFAAAAAAYEVLGDEQKRREYDRRLAVERARAAEPRRVRGAQPTGEAHYSWTNIAASGARAAQDESDFDELYETFFAPRVRAMREVGKPGRAQAAHPPPTREAQTGAPRTVPSKPVRSRAKRA